MVGRQQFLTVQDGWVEGGFAGAKTGCALVLIDRPGTAQDGEAFGEETRIIEQGQAVRRACGGRGEASGARCGEAGSSLRDRAFAAVSLITLQSLPRVTPAIAAAAATVSCWLAEQAAG